MRGAWLWGREGCADAPGSFGIGYNYNRREAALRDVAALKSASLIVWMGCRDFPAESAALTGALERLHTGFSVLFHVLAQTMVHQAPDPSGAQVYLALDQLQRAVHGVACVEDPFRSSAMYVRIQQAMQSLLESVERLQVIHDYRTPSSLRGFAMVYLTLYPAIFAPLFSLYAHLYGLWAGLYCSLISSLMFTALYRIFVNDEDPFDGTGVDDLSMEPLTAHLRHMTYNRHSTAHISVFSKEGRVWGHQTFEELPPDVEAALEHHVRPTHSPPSYIHIKEQQE